LRALGHKGAAKFAAKVAAGEAAFVYFTDPDLPAVQPFRAGLTSVALTALGAQIARRHIIKVNSAAHLKVAAT